MNKLHYDAFISYRHIPADMKIAKKLQNLLESYKILDKGTGKKRHIRVFRDESELPTSGNLGADICTALDNSDYLIIIYSPTTKNSKWCMEELRYFQSLHTNTNDNILPLIISGEPAEVLPEELTYIWKEITDDEGKTRTVKLEIEPLCADVRAKDLRKQISRLKKKEHMRIAAPILEVGFDDLYQRQRRKVMTKAFTVGCAAFFGVLLFGIYNYNMLKQLSEKQEHIRQNESNRIAYLAEEQSEDVNLAITLALTGADLLEDIKIAGSGCERVLKQLVFQEKMEEKKNLIYVDAIIPLNARYMLGNIYADGACITLSDYTDTYLYDVENGALLFQYPSMDIYFNSSATQYIVYTKEGSKWSFNGYNMDTGTLFYQEEFVMMDDNEGFVQFAYDENTDKYYLGITADQAYPFLKEVLSDGKNRNITINEIPDEMKEMMQGQSWDGFLDYIYGSPYDYQMSDYEQGKLSDDRQARFDEVLKYGFYVQGAYDLGNSGLECLEIAANEDVNDSPFYLIFDKETNQVVDYTEYKIDVLEGTDKLIKYLANGIEILSVHRDYVPVREDDMLRSMISTDGERFLNVYDTSNEYFDWSKTSLAPALKLISAGSGKMKINSSYLLVTGGINGKEQDVFSKEIYGNPLDDRQRGNLVFYTTPDMHRIAYVTPEGILEVVELPSGKVLYSETIEFSMENRAKRSHVNSEGELDEEWIATPGVFAVSLDMEGEVLAVAYVNDEVALYSVETGHELQRFRSDELFDMPWISCMEFNEEYLLLANRDKTVLLSKLTPGVYDLDDVKFFEGGEECYGAPKFLTSDGLLFVTYEMGSDYFLDNIYDIETNQNKFDACRDAQNYSYDPNTGYLIWEDDTETYRTGSKHIAKRNKEGDFEMIGEIRPETYDMQLPSHGAVLDGNLVLMEKNNMTELFDLESQTKIYTFASDNLRIQNGLLYDMETFGTNAESVYDLNINFSDLREKAEEMITSGFGTRMLNDMERRKFYIDESLYNMRK